MIWYWYLIALAAAALGTLATTPFALWVARRFDVIDYPDNERIHLKPTPRLGGIALFVGLLCGAAVLLLLAKGLREPALISNFAPHINYYGVAVAVALIFILGLVDDFLNIPAPCKFAGQIVAACVAIASGVLFDHFTNPLGNDTISLGLFAYPITALYLVAFCNIINLIDGLDGQAAGIVAISSVALFVLSIDKANYLSGFYALSLIGACCAFLRYNSHPARIFMGDSGALLLGFSLGLISLLGVVRAPALTTLFLPVVAAGIPVVDTFAALVRRMRAKRSIAQRDSEHIHHRLVHSGLSQRTAVHIMYAISALLALSACLMAQYNVVLRGVIIAVLLALTIVITLRLRLFDTTLIHHRKKRDRSHRESSLESRSESPAEVFDADCGESPAEVFDADCSESPTEVFDAGRSESHRETPDE